MSRLQHAVLALSFLLLVVTGFMLRYPRPGGGRHPFGEQQRFRRRGLLHRLAGVVLIAAGLWHMSYLLFTREGRHLFRDLLPAWRDVVDPWKVLR